MKLKRHIASGRAMLAAEAVGSGDPVVFVHAAVCDRRMWREQVDAVGAGYKAITYDRRGFGETSTEEENFSAVADLFAVLDGFGEGKPAVLVGCSAGGKIALDAVLQHPARVRALVLISPSVAGGPDPVYPPDIRALMAKQKKAEEAGDLDELIAIKAHLWLDGPLQSEGRVGGEARRYFLDMNAIALRSPPVGSNLDTAPNFDRLREISAPALVMCGDFDFPHIQERCKHMASVMPGASYRVLPGVAHLPSLEKPADVTPLVTAFIVHLSDRSVFSA
jgi:pimeloyl-ACP methyl ester carboxylesterase